MRIPTARMYPGDYYATVNVENISEDSARCAYCCSSRQRSSFHTHICRCRYLLCHWDKQSEKKGSVTWSTTSHLMLANLLKLQNLDTVHGWGSARLVNARESKPAEVAIMAMPPAHANLITRRQGDRVLSLSVHLALLGQVRHVAW